MYDPDLREIVFLSSFALGPALFLAFVRPVVRWVFFIMGLIVGFGIGYVMTLGGPDSPLLIIPLAGLGVAAGALLVEAIAFPIRLLRHRRAAAQSDGAD